MQGSTHFTGVPRTGERVQKGLPSAGHSGGSFLCHVSPALPSPFRRIWGPRMGTAPASSQQLCSRLVGWARCCAWDNEPDTVKDILASLLLRICTKKQASRNSATSKENVGAELRERQSQRDIEEERRMPAWTAGSPEGEGWSCEHCCSPHGTAGNPEPLHRGLLRAV